MPVKHLVLSFLFTVCFFNLLSAQELAERQVHFASDSYELTIESQAVLDELITLTQSATDFTFHLKGHTDLDGTNSYNETLSIRRNQAVRYYLNQQGVADQYISLAAFGERQPLDYQENESAKAINRRVEVLLTYDPINSVEEMLSHFAKQRQQHFVVNCQQGGEVKAADGTIVRIPADAFVYEDGRPVTNETVDLIIEEAVRPSAMIFHQLNTSHGDQALSTGGMIRLSAVANGEPLTLREEKELDVFVPTTAADPSMRLYDGSRDEEGAMVWEELAAPVNILTSNEVETGPVPFPRHIFAGVDHIEVPAPEYPGKLIDLSMPAIPKMKEPATKLMQKPYKPGVPQRQIASAPKGLFAKMRFDAAKEQAKLEKKYEQRMANYEERMIDYEKALVVYAANQKQYNEELAVIKADYEVEKELIVEERKHKINAWLNQCYAYEAVHRLQERIDEYKNDLSAETIHEKLYPSLENKKLPSFQFNISLKALEYFARGERMPPNEEPRYSEYLSAANDAAQRLFVETNFDRAWSNIKYEYLAYQNAKAERLRGDNKEMIDGLASKLDYYGYKVAAPNFSRWCNIDTPIPMGQSLLAFENTRFSELFTFVPKSKMVNYFPMNKSKTALFPAGQELNYLAFRYINDGVQIATGKFLPKPRDQKYLKFTPSTLAEVEKAILALDM